MGWRTCVFSVLVAGCMHDNLVQCSDGRLCPDSTVCDLVHASCVTAAQTTVCATKADGDKCDAAGDLGICDQGTCVPGCGDGVHGAGEECDDGNARDHDGCSAACSTETPTWTRWRAPWSGRVSAAAAFHPDAGGIVLFGGSDDAGIHGDQWHIRNPDDWLHAGPLGPPARTRHAMVYDSTRQVLVLFGGIDRLAMPLGDTWEYDGATWTQRTPTSSPAASADITLAYDSVHQRVVMFAGLAGETWEYDGTTWTQRFPSVSPPARLYQAMAYDPTRDKVVMFSGVAAVGVQLDTWEYDNGTWTSIGGAMPAVRVAAAMGYCPARGKIVLFGGVVLPEAVGNDTWEYGSSGWSKISVGVTTPPVRYFAQLAPVGLAAGDECLLIGGADAEGGQHPDVWRYTSAGVWTEETPHFIPEPREAGMVYDEARDQLVMYGGATLIPRNDAWTFDGALWHAASGTALSRSAYGVTYDSKRNVAVLFGGNDGSPGGTNTTLEWNGSAWTSVTPTTSPPARILPALAFDRDHGVTVLFGGRSNTMLHDDTWEYDGTTWTEVAATPHPIADELMLLSYDPLHHWIVGFGIDGLTWVYENHAWRSYAVAGPTPRNGANLVFNQARGTTMLIGGVGESFVYQTAIWELTFGEDGEPVWQSTDVIGASPDARYHAAAAYLPGASSIALFGGSSITGQRNDTWFLTYD